MSCTSILYSYFPSEHDSVGRPHRTETEHAACVLGSQQGAPAQPGSMPPLRERQKKRARDKARAARWALDNAPQATTTTAPGGLELDTLCAARLWLSAGAAAPGLAVGAGAGGLSRAQKRKAQRDKPLDQAQRDGALDGRSRAGQDRLQCLVQARCK